METTPTDYKHVVIDEDGPARVEGTPYKVWILIAQWKAWDLSPEALCAQHEGLSLSQFYSAPAYYFDHKHELDAKIERRTQEVREHQEKSTDEAVMKRLRDGKQQREEKPQI